MMQLNDLMKTIADFSDETFGTGNRNPAIAMHLREEVEELIDALKKGKGSDPDKRHQLLFEYADCFILLLDSLRSCGFSTYDLIAASRAKMKINRKRKWGKPDKNGIIKHIKTEL